MKKYILPISFVFTVLVLSACGSGQQETSQEASQEKKTTKIKLEVPNFDTTRISKADVEAMINPYLSLKDAFVASNAERSQKLAEELANAIQNEALQSVKADAQAIQQSTDLESQRLSFYQLSAKIFFLVKNIGGNKEPLYQQYCPMAFNDQGAYWLSKENKIRNPYFGDEMLTCGIVNEALAVK
ncbi:MAG: DUF3347 domain-containing protein [Thermoflexibacter sp.]